MLLSASDATRIISRYMLADVLPVIPDLERSRGTRLYDALSKRFLIDCISYIASAPVGHNHAGLNDEGFEKKLLRAAKNKPSSSDFHTVEMAEFVETFARVAMPQNLKKMFLVEGGSVAVENALKAAFDWKVQQNFLRGCSTERGSKIVHFRECFHGRTGYTLSLTNAADDRKTRYFPKFDWPRIENPKVRFPLERHLSEVLQREALAAQQLQQVFANQAYDIAAIIIEPIQGEGGDNHFRPEFFQLLRDLADRWEAMLIVDEVQSGLGITGKMWAFEHFGIQPDLLAFGKKVQVCGFLSSERISDVTRNVFAEPSRLNSTWGGALVDMVRSARYLEIIEAERLVENAAAVGAVFTDGLLRLEEAFPQVFENARGRGLMAAIDLIEPARRDEFLTEALERGLLLLKSGNRSLRFRPSLTFSREDAAEVLDILGQCAKRLS